MNEMPQYVYHNEKSKLYFGKWNATANDIEYKIDFSKPTPTQKYILEDNNSKHTIENGKSKRKIYRNASRNQTIATISTNHNNTINTTEVVNSTDILHNYHYNASDIESIKNLYSIY